MEWGKNIMTLGRLQPKVEMWDEKRRMFLSEFIKTKKRLKKVIYIFKKISARPCNTLLWSKKGIQLYHKLASKCVLFWNATGGVVRRGNV